jgi:HlyD family secretion protein
VKTLVWGAVAVAVVAAVAIVWPRVGSDKSKEVGKPTELARVVRRDIATVVKATGVIKPRIGAEVRVGSRTSGVVRRLYVRVGDSVSKGQLLADLDDRELVARRAEAAAAVEASSANLAYARADLRRKSELSTSGLIPPSDLELVQRASMVAEQQWNQARAALDSATTQVSYARIVAPIAGVVSSVSTQEGETVAASFASPTFVTLLDLTRLEVWAYVDETDIGRIQLQQKARFTVDTYADGVFEGRVAAVYPQAEIRDNVVNYISVVRFDLPHDRILRPEMTAAVRIAVAARSAVLTVPVRAVHREGGRAFVWCPRGDTVERRFVETGGRDESFCEITNGLREGDTVIVGDVAAKGDQS